MRRCSWIGRAQPSRYDRDTGQCQPVLRQHMQLVRCSYGSRALESRRSCGYFHLLRVAHWERST